MTYFMTTTTGIEQEVADHFLADVAAHRLHVLHEDGLYRHLRFKADATHIGHFDLVAWPGHLTVCGDREAYVFSRQHDMFEFFRAGRVNPVYWSEKTVHVGGRQSCREYSEAATRALVTEHLADAEEDYPGVTAAWAGYIDHCDEVALTAEDTARDELERFVYRPAGWTDERPFAFFDVWEWDLTDWGWHFLWSYHAIRWGIQQYDAAG